MENPLRAGMAWPTIARITGADVACATARLEGAGTEDGKSVTFTLRLTVCLEQRDGEWTIVHEHHAQPLDFGTARIGTGPH